MSLSVSALVVIGLSAYVMSDAESAGADCVRRPVTKVPALVAVDPATAGIFVELVDEDGATEAAIVTDLMVGLEAHRIGQPDPARFTDFGTARLAESGFVPGPDPACQTRVEFDASVRSSSASLRFVEIRTAEPVCDAVRSRTVLRGDGWLIDDVMLPRPGGLEEICGGEQDEELLSGASDLSVG